MQIFLPFCSKKEHFLQFIRYFYNGEKWSTDKMAEMTGWHNF